MAHRDPRRLSRRQFGLLGTQVSGAVVAVLLGIPIVGFLISPLFRQQQVVWRKVGDISGVADGEPTKFEVAFPQDVWTTAEENLAVYVVKSGDNTGSSPTCAPTCSDRCVGTPRCTSSSAPV